MRLSSFLRDTARVPAHPAEEHIPQHVSNNSHSTILLPSQHTQSSSRNYGVIGDKRSKYPSSSSSNKTSLKDNCHAIIPQSISCNNPKHLHVSHLSHTPNTVHPTQTAHTPHTAQKSSSTPHSSKGDNINRSLTSVKLVKDSTLSDHKSSNHSVEDEKENES